MSEIQSLIYSLEVGSIRYWLVRLAMLAMIAGLGVFYYVMQFNGLGHPQAMDYAQLARQISSGEGYSTKFLRPSSLSYYRNAPADQSINTDQYPDLVNPPGYPVAMGVLFKLARPSFNLPTEDLKNYKGFQPETLIVLFNLTCLLFAAVFFYLWMRRAFDERVAIFSTFALILTDIVWITVIEGLSIPFLMCLICVLGFCTNEALIGEEDEAPIRATIFWTLGSIFLGLLVLSQYVYLAMWLPLVGLGILGSKRRIVTGIIVLLIPFLIIGPWFLRNISLVGHPFGVSWIQIFADTPPYEGSSIWRLYLQDPANAAGLRTLIRAIALGATDFLSGMGRFFGGTILVAAFVASCFHLFRRYRVLASRWFWLACLVFVVVFNSAILKQSDDSLSLTHNFYLPLLPVLAGFGSAFLFLLIDRLKLPITLLAYPILAIILIVQALPMGIRILQQKPSRFEFPPYFPPSILVTNVFMEEKELVCTDIPWAYAWYANRPCVWLPHTQNDFFSMNDFDLPTSAVILTPYTKQREFLSDIQVGEYKDWAVLITRSDLS
ncbi:MAG: hypothetical protein AAFY98_07600, partial [Verrucomicrobiota bacterium]